VPEELTFVASFTLPKKEDGRAVSGTLFHVGEGEQALDLLLRDGVLVLKAANQEIVARTVAVPFGEDEAGKDQPIQVAGAFDGNQLRLFVGGTAYRIYDWTAIWLITTVISAVLLVAFVALFHDNPKGESGDEQSQEQEPQQEQPSAESVAEAASDETASDEADE
jgi:hypothetical protein